MAAEVELERSTLKHKLVVRKGTKQFQQLDMRYGFLPSGARQESTQQSSVSQRQMCCALITLKTLLISVPRTLLWVRCYSLSLSQRLPAHNQQVLHQNRVADADHNSTCAKGSTVQQSTLPLGS